MHRSARDLDPFFQCRPMNPQTVKSFATECGDQRGVHVENPMVEAGCEIAAENAHEPRENDQVDGIVRKQSADPRLHACLSAALAFHDKSGRDSRFFGSFQRISVRAIGDDKRDFAAVQKPFPLGVDERLKVCSAAGDQYGNVDLILFRFHFFCVSVLRLSGFFRFRFLQFCR